MPNGSMCRQPGTRTLQSWFWRPARALRVAHEVEPEGIEPSFPDCQPGVFPLDDGPEARVCFPIALLQSAPPYTSVSWQPQTAEQESNLRLPGSGTDVTRTRIFTLRT